MKLTGRKTVKTGKVSAPMTATGSVARKVSAVAKHEPTHDEIAVRAYEFYLSRGSIEGHEEEDWLLAEAELRK